MSLKKKGGGGIAELSLSHCVVSFKDKLTSTAKSTKLINKKEDKSQNHLASEREREHPVMISERLNQNPNRARPRTTTKD